MYPRKQLPHAEQIVRLKRYLRRSRTELRHRYDELFEVTKGRRDCPLEVSLRRRMTVHFQDLVSLLEACVEEMQRQEAMFYAPFKPGDRILVERNVDDVRTTFGPYLIVDVVPDKDTMYAYECAHLTKAGAMYTRRSHTRVWPRAPSRISNSDVPLNHAGQWESEYFRRCAAASRELAFATGDLTLFEGQKDLLDRPFYRRKDRLGP